MLFAGVAENSTLIPANGGTEKTEILLNKILGKEETMNNCKNCKHSIFNEQWGEFKCAVRKRTCIEGEVRHGCVRWSKKEKEKK